MAWEWSHSTEGIDNAFENLKNKDREWLETCWCEWQAAGSNENYGEREFTQTKYDRAIKRVKKIADDCLIDDIWNKMQEQALCNRGSFDAWACPYGCHTISFNLDK